MPDLAFLTRPSRARTRLVVGVLIAMVVVFALTEIFVLGLICAAALFAVTLLMLDDSTGEVTNGASVLAGRPIALTARGRSQVSVDHLPPEQVRARRLAFLTALAIATFAGVVIVANAL